MKRTHWPLLLIAAPAAVAIWSGWVGLGGMAGFGTIAPLPGILPWHLDTAITLPVGVEAYGAYALGAWLGSWGVPDAARQFARRSAIGALLLGMTGQVVYHLLAAGHATRAPWPVVVLVSCVPVVTLGFAAALTHLLRGTQPEAMAQAAEPLPVAEPLPAPVVPLASPQAMTAPKRKPAKRQSSREATDARDLRTVTAMLADGTDVTVAAVQKRLGTRFDRAKRLLGTARAEPTMEPYAIPEPAVSGNGNGAKVH